MLVEAEIKIQGTRAMIWEVITNIQDAAKFITGIEKIELIDIPTNGIIGLKWRESRIYFGELSTVEKWITDANENIFYKTKSEIDGFEFTTHLSIDGNGDSLTLKSSHDTRPIGFLAKLKSIPMILFKGVIKKAILQDLIDIKSEVERK